MHHLLQILIFVIMLFPFCDLNAQNEYVADSDSARILDLTPQQKDSLVFRLTHHYTINYNFIVKADSIMLTPREGDIIQDTCFVKKGELIAVAEIKTIPGDSIDSIWIKVAHDQWTMGWIHEDDLLDSSVPNDEISELLHAMTTSRGFWMSALLLFGICAYLFHRGESRQLYLLKFEEMSSIYPFLFLSLVAIMASVYATVQNFVPEFWQEYYYHPVLTPWKLPFIMALLLSLVWLVIIVFIAVLDEVYNHFYFIPGMAYIFELLGLAMFVYLAISWTTLIYVGYILLAGLLYFIGWAYIHYVLHKEK